FFFSSKGDWHPPKFKMAASRCGTIEVIGRVPKELTGRFLRIGPNPIDELDQVHLLRYHWFAGTGLAHGLRLRDGKAEWFRSRFVLDRAPPRPAAVGRSPDQARARETAMLIPTL